MTWLGRGQSSSCTNPALDIYTSVGTALTDVVELSFQVFEDNTTPGTPVQIYPATSGTREIVNVADCPTGGKIGLGHYAANFTALPTYAAGNYEIWWFFKFDALESEQAYVETFQILTVTGNAGFAYATIQDVRDQGVTEAAVSDNAVRNALIRATAFIDNFTGRHFAPDFKTIYVDSRGEKDLRLMEPIINIDSVSTVCCDGAEDTLDLDQFKVYNRHLANNLRSPDDRDNPHLSFCCSTGELRPLYELFSCCNWSNGPQKIKLVGTFGYTDYDGSGTGKIPDLISFATARLAVQYATPKVTSAATIALSLDSSRIKKERTADQSIEYFSPSDMSTTTTTTSSAARPNDITGDEEVDSILIMYKAPMAMGAV